MSQLTIQQALARIQELEAMSASAVTVTSKKSEKNGKTYVTVKGIPGTGWGISMEPHGWNGFLTQLPALQASIRKYT